MGHTEQKQDLESAIRRLAELDPSSINDIIFLARQRRRYRALEALPFPVKLALLQTFLFFLLLAITPWPPDFDPVVYIPLMWITTYCLMLALYWFIPHHRDRHPPAHWVE